MTILLSHTTALEALRDPSLDARLERGERTSCPLPESLPTDAEVASARASLPSLAVPLHVTVTEDALRWPVRLVSAHVTRVALPPGSTVRVSEGVLSASPEHVAVQMAPQLTPIELVFLLGELMGTYAISPNSEGGMRARRTPLTNRARIIAHLDALGRAPGTGRVRRALEMACERSASPYETRLSMRLGLRPALGGYNLRVLSMNEPLEVARIGSALGAGIRKPDVLLGGARRHAPFSAVSFDYNGRVHETSEGYERDARRQNDLLAAGVKNYVLTKALYDDLDCMDDLVCRARADLGLERQHLTLDEQARRRELRRRLHDELELIDGVSWDGLERERTAREAGARFEPVCVDVPLEVNGIA